MTDAGAPQSIADLSSSRLDWLPGFTGSAPTTGIILAAVLALAIILFPFAFYRRRNVQPCRARRNFFMIEMLLNVTVMNATYLTGMITETACLLSFWIQDAMTVGILTIYLTRTFVLFFQHRTVDEQRILSTVTGADGIGGGGSGGVKAALAEFGGGAKRTAAGPRPSLNVKVAHGSCGGAQKQAAAVPAGMWFLRHRYLLDPSYLYPGQFAVFCVAVVPTTANTFLHADVARGWSALQCVSAPEVYNTFQNIIVVVSCVFLVLYTCLAAPLSRYGPDNLGIRLELKVAGVILVLASISSLVVSSTVAVLPYPVQDVTVVVSGTLLLANSFLTPVFLSYKHHHLNGGAENTERFAGSLQAALASPEMRDAFKRFCEKEFSAENLMFHEDVEHFRNMYQELKTQPDGQMAILQLASDIVDRYVAPTALYEINVGHGLKNTVTRNFQDAQARSVAPDVTIFDAMQKHIFQLMSTDSFSRFLCSEDAVRQVGPDPSQSFHQL